MESLPHLPGDIRVGRKRRVAPRWWRSLVPAGTSSRSDGRGPRLPLARPRPRGPAGEHPGWRPAAAVPAMRKSPAEIAIIAHSHGDHARRAPAGPRPDPARHRGVGGRRFIDAAHWTAGADDGSTFAIVSFGPRAPSPWCRRRAALFARRRVVLVDTGCRIDGTTPTSPAPTVLDPPSPAFERIWRIEREAQQAVFDAAKIGRALSALTTRPRRARRPWPRSGTTAARSAAPRRPRLGLEIHEEPYIVRGQRDGAHEGMVFSNRAMIVVPGAFGVRLEDHVHMTATGPAWFTPPSKSRPNPSAETAKAVSPQQAGVAGGVEEMHPFEVEGERHARSRAGATSESTQAESETPASVKWIMVVAPKGSTRSTPVRITATPAATPRWRSPRGGCRRRRPCRGPAVSRAATAGADRQTRAVGEPERRPVTAADQRRRQEVHRREPMKPATKRLAGRL